MFTYFVQDGRPEYVKIGKSKDIIERLTEGDTWSPIPFRVLLKLLGNRETEMHARFRAEHVRGEWFRLSERLRQFIEAELAKPDKDGEWCEVVTELFTPELDRVFGSIIGLLAPLSEITTMMYAAPTPQERQIFANVLAAIKPLLETAADDLWRVVEALPSERIFKPNPPPRKGGFLLGRRSLGMDYLSA